MVTMLSFSTCPCDESVETEVGPEGVAVAEGRAVCCDVEPEGCVVAGVEPAAGAGDSPGLSVVESPPQATPSNRVRAEMRITNVTVLLRIKSRLFSPI